ncbi:MAG: ThiF family adenylyltransferase [Candidatus Omnitrophica bacterium]|nr:ThiF family adenylyltransferase [Candidatus Omnitrophota bacterium]
MNSSAETAGEADQFFREAFCRNIGLLTEEEQEKLRRTTVGVIGAGGVGGLHLTTLARLGVGGFHIADMDRYELANVQRQCGAFVHTLGKNKAEAMREIALGINPHLRLKVFSEQIGRENIHQFLEGVDVLIDGIDFFSLEARRCAFDAARERGVYTVTAGPLGFGSAMLVFAPQDGMTFDEYFDIHPDMNETEKIIAFAVGLAPAALHMRYLNLGSVNLKKKSGPSLVTACTLCGVLAATEVIRIVLRKDRPAAVPHYFQYDPYLQKLKKGYVRWGNRHPLQRVKRWYLARKLGARA